MTVLERPPEPVHSGSLTMSWCAMTGLPYSVARGTRPVITSTLIRAV